MFVLSKNPLISVVWLAPLSAVDRLRSSKYNIGSKVNWLEIGWNGVENQTGILRWKVCVLSLSCLVFKERTLATGRNSDHAYSLKCTAIHGLVANEIQPNSHIYSWTIVIYVNKYAASDHDAIDRGIYLVIIPWQISIIRYEPKAIELHVIMCIEKTALVHSFE